MAADTPGVTNADRFDLDADRVALELHHGPGFADHGSRVAGLAVAIGRRLALHSAELASLRVASIVHDIGKVELDRNILAKPGPLSDEETAVMRQHPEIGHQRLEGVMNEAVCEAVLHHHEWWNGQGYPAGLRGQEIPLFARIILVADAYEVMVTGRDYQPQLSTAEALQELQRAAGTQFDPGVVDALGALDRSLLALD